MVHESSSKNMNQVAKKSERCVQNQQHEEFVFSQTFNHLAVNDRIGSFHSEFWSVTWSFIFGHVSDFGFWWTVDSMNPKLHETEAWAQNRTPQSSGMSLEVWERPPHGASWMGTSPDGIDASLPRKTSPFWVSKAPKNCRDPTDWDTQTGKDGDLC